MLMASLHGRHRMRKRNPLIQQAAEEIAEDIISSMSIEDDGEIAPVGVLSRDAKKAIIGEISGTLEARYLVNMYQQIQRDRIRTQLRVASLKKAGSPHLIFEYYLEQYRILERNAAKVLVGWAKTQPQWEWLIGIRGIGPVIAACLIAYVRPEYCKSAGSIWRYAGIDVGPMDERATTKFSRDFKRLCWLIGQSFIRTKSDDSFYYHLYLKRKAYEQEKNERGEYAEQAANILKQFNYDSATTAYAFYKNGMLPPMHIHNRATRYAVKIFLSHLAQVTYEMTYNEPQPTPYAMAILGHKDYIAPPNYTPLAQRANQLVSAAHVRTA